MAKVVTQYIFLNNFSVCQIPYDITYMWNPKKMRYMNLFMKQKQTQTQKTNIRLPKGIGGWGGDMGVWN